jgi:hypothetical protein
VVSTFSFIDRRVTGYRFLVIAWLLAAVIALEASLFFPFNTLASKR